MSVTIGPGSYIGSKTLAGLLSTGARVTLAEDMLRTPKLGSEAKAVSLVVPCFDEEEVIVQTVEQLKRFCNSLEGMKSEIIFVDDGSRDRTREILKGFALEDSSIKVVGLARNFGHQVAVTAGIDAAIGDAIVILDADLQDPPAVMHQMIEKWLDGYDVVYGQRSEREGESAFKRATARAFYRVLNCLSEVRIPVDTGDFRLISRSVVEALKAMPERDRFVRGMISWIGFKQTALSYKREKRHAGVSKYPLRRMLRLAMDGLLSFSIRPLQMSVTAGMFSAALAMVGIVYAIVLRVFTAEWVEGWTALMIAVLFIGGVQLISIGILGEYIGRIYLEIKGRPLYVADEYVGFGSSGPSMSRSPVVKSK